MNGGVRIFQHRIYRDSQRYQQTWRPTKNWGWNPWRMHRFIEFYDVIILQPSILQGYSEMMWDVYDVWQTMLTWYEFDTTWWGFTRIWVYHNGHTGGKPWILWTNAGCGGKSRCKWIKLTEIHWRKSRYTGYMTTIGMYWKKIIRQILNHLRNERWHLEHNETVGHEKRTWPSLLLTPTAIYLYVFFCCSIISHMMLSKQPHVLRWMPQGTPRLFWWVKSNMEFRCFQKLCEMGIAAPQPVCRKHLKISSTLIAMEAPEMHRTIQLICNLKIPIFALVLPWFPSFSVQKWRPTSHQWVISIGQAATSKAQVFFVSPTLSWLLPAWPHPRHMARKIPRELPKVPCPTLAPHSETGSSPSLPSVSSPPPRNEERNDRNEHLVEMKHSRNHSRVTFITVFSGNYMLIAGLYIYIIIYIYTIIHNYTHTLLQKHVQYINTLTSVLAFLLLLC